MVFSKFLFLFSDFLQITEENICIGYFFIFKIGDS